MVCSLLCCGQCCGSISLIGVFFLLAVAGILNSGSGAIHVEGEGVTPELAAQTAVKAAAIYGGFLAASLMCYIKGRMNQKNRVVIEDPRPRASAGGEVTPGGLNPSQTTFHTVRTGETKSRIN